MKFHNLSVRVSLVELESGAAVIFDFASPIALRTATGGWYKSLTLSQAAMPVLRYYFQEVGVQEAIGLRQSDLLFRVDRL